MWLPQLKSNWSADGGMNAKENLRFSDSPDIWNQEDEKAEEVSGLYFQGQENDSINVILKVFLTKR